MVNRYDNVSEWDELAQGHQELIKAKSKAMMDKPPVPGAGGKIDRRKRVNGRWESVPEGTPGGVVQRCYQWQHDTGEPNSFHCKNPGQRVTNCPNKNNPPVNAVQPVQESVPVAGGVTMDDFKAMQVNTLQAMQHIAGGDAMIEDIIAKAQSSAVIMVHQLGQRTSALLVVLDDGRTVLLDTGSLHTMMTRREWQRLFDDGTASRLAPKTDGITFISAAGDYLGYTHWAVVEFPVAGTTRKVVVRVVNNMEQTFPVLLGLDGLAAAKGITNHIDSVVTFRDDAGVDHQYPFVLPASVSGVAAAKSGGQQRRAATKSSARGVADGNDVELDAVLAVDCSGANNRATTPTGFFHVGVGPPKIDAVTFDTVAVNATRAVLDTSFDQTVEWRDPYLDPYMPQSTVGGFMSWFETDV